MPVDNHAHLHTVEQNLSLLAPLNLPALSDHVTMSYDPQDWQACEQRLQKQGVAGSYIVVQPTSRWFFKCWSEEKMAATLTALQADGHQLVITSGPDAREQAMVERILALCPPQGVISLAGQLTLRQLAALIDHAKLFIGVDSVPMHMAAALQTPCVALFGPSKLTFWRPWQATGAVIWAGDFGELPDPDAIDTGTDERYLDFIPTDAVIAAARARWHESISFGDRSPKIPPGRRGRTFRFPRPEALEQQDLDLNVITREWQGDANPNWHIHLCNPLKLGRISRERGFAVAAGALWEKERFDLVQSHERIPGCDIYRAGDGVHRRWLLQRARLLPEWRRKWLFSNRYHRYVMCAERAMYAAPELKAVICNAEMIKQEIIADFGVPADKITVIYNAIDNQKFPPADEAQRQRLREQYQIPQRAHCLIFVGSGFERKGLAAAIRAVAATDSHLPVVGKDKDEKRYRALAQSLGCSDRVHFMGVQKQTLPFYQAADALLLPTLYDPFPNVILEAMSCGLPVITSTTCGGAEFITPARTAS